MEPEEGPCWFHHSPSAFFRLKRLKKISQGYDRPGVSHFDGAADMQVRFKQVGIDVGRRAKFVERCGNPL